MFPWHLDILFKFLKEWCPISFNFSQAIVMICCFSPIVFVCLLPIPFHWYKPALRALPSNQVIGHKRDLVKSPHHWDAYLILICFSGNYVDNNGRLRKFQQIIRVLGSTSLLGNYCYLAKGELFWTHSILFHRVPGPGKFSFRLHF